MVDVVSRIETATIVAPCAPAASARISSSLFAPLRMDRGSILSVLREIQLMRRGAAFVPVTVEEDHDVCLFVAQFPTDLVNLRRVRGWRKRSRLAIAFILETWPNLLKRSESELKLLNDFDHVFVLNEDSIPDLRRRVSTPISFLATATDCLRAAPVSIAGPRPIDVVSTGRSLAPVHLRLLQIARERDLFYVFDAWTALKAINWAEVRDANAAAIKRSKYSIVWDPSVSMSKMIEMGHQRTLTTRYFESAAGGAVVLGSRSSSTAFETHFDWPDAVVPIAPDGSDVAERIAELDADPDRCAAIRRANTVNCLRRHDWSHRWGTMVATLGLEGTAAHADRHAALEARASAIEGAPSIVPLAVPAIVARAAAG